MIQIERHIELLLLTNDCVIVPDLGAFVSHHVDARYDDDGSFVPPIRTLGFNPQLTINDSLLVQSYIEAYDMSYPEALRLIEDEVGELKQHLQTKGEYMLNNIGLLSMNAEGHMVFEPCEAGILTPAYYGLGAFQMPTLLNSIEDKEDTAEKSTLATDGHKPDSEVIYIKMSWLRNAVAVAAAFIAFLMISTPISNSSENADTHQSAFIPFNVSRNADVHTTPTATQEETDTPKEMTAEAEASTATTSEEPSSDDIGCDETNCDLMASDYCIVMASHVSEHNATLFIEQLKAAGYYDARIWVNQNGVRRVVYGSYPSKADADSTLRQLRGESRLFRDTWITEIKP